MSKKQLITLFITGMLLSFGLGALMDMQMNKWNASRGIKPVGFQEFVEHQLTIHKGGPKDPAILKEFLCKP